MGLEDYDVYQLQPIHPGFVWGCLIWTEGWGCVIYIYFFYVSIHPSIYPSINPSIYPLVICYIAIENGPVEIVDVPIQNGGSFHSFWYVYQRVSQIDMWSQPFPSIIELDYGKIYRKALYLMVKTMVSCRVSLKPIQWLQKIPSFHLQAVQRIWWSFRGRGRTPQSWATKPQP